MTTNLKLSYATGARGASMGRSATPSAGHLGKPCGLAVVRINSQGYDSGGAYWGTGMRLYLCTNADNRELMYIRATDRAAAKERLTREFPGITFKR